MDGVSFSRSMAMPRKREWRARFRSRSSSRPMMSTSACTGVLPSSFRSQLSAQDVICIGPPIGRQPCATTVSMVMEPATATPTAPDVRTSPPTYRALPPPVCAPLARPPIVALPGKA